MTNKEMLENFKNAGDFANAMYISIGCHNCIECSANELCKKRPNVECDAVAIEYYNSLLDIDKRICENFENVEVFTKEFKNRQHNCYGCPIYNYCVRIFFNEHLTCNEVVERYYKDVKSKAKKIK
jgi:hypothetical protein